MNIEKIKEIIKNKKVQAISGAVAGALIIAVAGTMILHNNNIENKTIAIENKLEDKEELTVEDTDQDKEVEENTDEHIHDENCNHDEENSTSQENNQVVEQNNNNSSTNKQEETNQNNSDKKVSTTTQTNANNSNKSDTASNSNSNTNINRNEHTHSWVEVYKDVYHAEEGHYENVLVKEAWTETVPIYETKIVNICNGCGADITGNEITHAKEQMLAGNMACSGFHNEQRQVQTGTNTINHDAVYEQKWVVDKAAWTEKVLSGYKCNSCGATK